MSEPVSDRTKESQRSPSEPLRAFLAKALLSSTLALGLDRLFSQNPLVSGDPREVISIDRIGSGWGWLIGGLIVFLILLVEYLPVLNPPRGILARSIRFLPFKPRVLALILVLSGGLSAGIGLYFLNSLPEVEPMHPIEGRIEAPRQLVGYLFVRPSSEERCWLQRPVPLIVGEDGRWHTEAFFGGGPGQVFDVIAIAVPTPIPGVTAPGAHGCDTIPSNAYRATRVVRRR